MKALTARDIDESGRVIAWWSGGVTSAVACYWAINRFPNVEIVFLDTKNEDDDTYRFLDDCERILYGKNHKITRLSNPAYESIKDVWKKYLSLNTAHGAICSTELKRVMRESYQNVKKDYAQVFGFEAGKKEENRHNNMRRNYPEINVISPLQMFGYTKEYCIDLLQRFGIEIPRAYKLGFINNNCLKTLCVQGGIGYFQHAKEIMPEVVHQMAMVEHELTALKGQPVTILKDQSKGGGLVFLEPHPDYPHMKDLSMMKGRKPQSLTECHGFCNTKN